VKISDKNRAESCFKATVRMLLAASLALVDDYPLEEGSNYKLLINYMSKTQLNKLRADIKRAVKFLLTLDSEKPPSSRELRNWAVLFDDWNAKLTQYHIEHHNHQWIYYATALHYMLDSYHHIFKRFLVSDSAISCSCNWCKLDLVTPWTSILENVLMNHVPNMYLYTAMAQAANADVDLSELPATTLDDLRELGRFALTN